LHFSQEKKSQPNSISRSSTVTADKEKKSPTSPIFAPQVPKSPQQKPILIKEKVYDKYKRDDGKTQSKQAQVLTR